MTRSSALAILIVGAVAPLVSAVPCRSGDSACAASDDDDVGLLQLGATRAMDAKNGSLTSMTSKIWDQLKGAVNIDHIQGAVQAAKDSNSAKKLKEHLAKLEKQFPGAAAVKEQFSSQWADISKAVDSEGTKDKLTKVLEDAKVAGPTAEVPAQ